MLTSLCIQIVRAEHKENCPTWIKRTFRIGGFLFSPVMVFYGPAVMVIISILAAVLIVTGNDGMVQKRRTKNRTISFVMVYHQMHYFIYTYIMPLTVIYLTKNIYMPFVVRRSHGRIVNGFFDRKYMGRTMCMDADGCRRRKRILYQRTYRGKRSM